MPVDDTSGASRLSSVKATSQRPSAPRAVTAGRFWLRPRVVATSNSSPSGAPSAPTRRPRISYPSAAPAAW